MLRIDKKKCVKAAAAVSISAVLMMPNTVLAAPALKVGSTGQDVTQLQNQLMNLGYYNYTKITGFYGSITRDAVIRFQKDKGLTADGIAGPSTFSALYNKDSKSKVTARSASTFQFSTVLKKGMKGLEVEKLQEALKLQGFYDYIVDGDFGPKTEAAVKQFQSAVKLTTDGIVGKITAGKLAAVPSNPSRGTDTEDRTNEETVSEQPAEPQEAPADVESSDSEEQAVPQEQAENPEVPVPEESVEVSQPSVDESQPSSDSASDNEESTVDNSEENASEQASIIEMLHWSEVDKLYPRKALARVTDIDTGKSFFIYRVGGQLHADVEPLTAEDTTIMKSIYGGQWSWSRRAIIVEIDGHKIAGSMNGMPHGKQDIHNNNFDGQFCIHFLGSKLHNKQKEDPEHQAMVKKAASFQLN